MNGLQTYTNELFGSVRTLLIDDEPWFVGKDVADILGYRNGSRDVNRHVDEDDRTKIMVSDGSQERETIVINEAGLYSLVFGSQLESAKQFKHWVTHDVLPSIRKQGYYSSIPDNQLAELLIANMNDKERLEHVIIPAMRESNIDQAVFTAKLTGMTANELQRNKTLVNKAIENDDAKSKLKKWKSQSSYVNHIFSADDFPEEYKNRFYMDGLILELSRKKAYRDFFANNYGKMYFNREGYFALLDVMERRKWITSAEKRSWKCETGLV